VASRPKLNPRQEAHLVTLYRAGEHTVSELKKPLLRSPREPKDPPAGQYCQVGVLGYPGAMSADSTELSVTQARDHFSDAVNRAAFGGEITYVTRGRGQQRAAAIVPADLVERYEELVDREDGRIASERLADLDAGRATAVSADEVTRALER
jgi:antitoxin (DNA-binding transcriptional repressor) of toxin-antitoxin stability system